ncbi:hypothetical protein RRG08_061596 [Elysia crispata]|uniref:Uncharacterized protein n=1 Tax=Elysia crispata TaxID=231223 RepID=A0AAE0YU55_9GAST|nr:hypothetical protein RRG08_061596 [Elysia crispata]
MDISRCSALSQVRFVLIAVISRFPLVPNHKVTALLRIPLGPPNSRQPHQGTLSDAPSISDHLGSSLTISQTASVYTVVTVSPGIVSGLRSQVWTDAPGGTSQVRGCGRQAGDCHQGSWGVSSGLEIRELEHLASRSDSGPACSRLTELGDRQAAPAQLLDLLVVAGGETSPFMTHWYREASTRSECKLPSRSPPGPAEFDDSPQSLTREVATGFDVSLTSAGS